MRDVREIFNYPSRLHVNIAMTNAGKSITIAYWRRLRASVTVTNLRKIFNYRIFAIIARQLLRGYRTRDDCHIQLKLILFDLNVDTNLFYIKKTRLGSLFLVSG